MNILETQLTGPLATLDCVVKVLDQSLARHGLSRVELHYSMFSPEPLIPQIAEQAITDLLRSRGKEFVAVAVLARATSAQNEPGDHLLRLHVQTADEAMNQFELAPGLPSCFRGILSHYFGDHSPSPQATHSPQHASGVSYADALALLRRAIGMAVTSGEATVGSPLRVRHDAQGQVVDRVVCAIQLVVRQGYLHQALVPMVTGAQEKAKQMLKTMLQANGLVMAAEFRVNYDYRPWCAQDGNASAAFPTEFDLQVQLQILGER